MVTKILIATPSVSTSATRNCQAYLRLSHRAQALDVLLPLVQDKAEQGGGGPPAGLVPQMSDEDHKLLDRLECRRVKLKRRISDMANRSFGSIFRYDVRNPWFGVSWCCLSIPPIPPFYL